MESIGAWLTDQAKLSVWLDRWVLIPGEHWQQHMAMGLDQARSCAICIGTHTPKGWFREEIERALNRQTRDPTFRVIPVILPGGNRELVDNFLELRTWVDFTEGLKDARAFHLLVSGVKGLPPGRFMPATTEVVDQTLSSIRKSLAHIKELRSQQLIDDNIALEFQRRLLDKLIGPGDLGDA